MNATKRAKNKQLPGPRPQTARFAVEQHVVVCRIGAVGWRCPTLRKRNNQRRRRQAANGPTSSSSGATTSAISDVSAYSHGLMGFQTPNIDRIAREGVMFTDYLRGAELHRRPGLIHHRPIRFAHRHDQGRPAGRHRSDCRRKTRRLPSCSSRSAMRPDNSARTISATATNFCRPCTASTSSTATSTT